MIYLDHNATTPIAPGVLGTMRPYLEQHFGNPSSAHDAGGTAAAAVVRARAEVAALLGGEPGDVVFTASGSEADNLALTGVALARLPNTLNVSFPGHDGERLLSRTPSIAAATGAACHSGRTEPSAVLTAMGLDRIRALGAVRLSLGYDTTTEQIEAAAAALAGATVHGAAV